MHDFIGVCNSTCPEVLFKAIAGPTIFMIHTQYCIGFEKKNTSPNRVKLH
jgi:hypothetical protein